MSVQKLMLGQISKQERKLMVHEEEIKLWAESPEHTKVWTRQHKKSWTLTSVLSWSPDNEYIVDNEFADLRKQQRDGEIIQFNPKLTMHDRWDDVVDLLVKPSHSLKHYRIKKKVASWQWLYEVTPGECGFSQRWQLTQDLYTEAEAAKRYRGMENILSYKKLGECVYKHERG